MSKLINFNDKSRNPLLNGVNVLANAVKVTLGPKGKNVMISHGSSAPHVTKDGVTVAKEIELEDPFENMGAQMAKEVASKTNDIAGDGTTTATVLAQAIANEGLKSVAAGANPMDIKIGIDKAVDKLIDEIKNNSVKVEDKKSIAQVGTISANNDSEIGELIADAMDKVGLDGVITVEESNTAQTVLDVVKGMQFNNGYLSPYFATSPETMKCQFDDALVLMYDRKIASIQDMLPHLEYVAGVGKPLVIIAEDVEAEALATLIMNKIRGSIRVCAIKAPGYGDTRLNNLADIAILTGGKVVSDDTGVSLKEAIPSEVLGSAKSITITKDSTTIVEGAGSKEDIEARVNQLKDMIETATSEYEKEKLKTRIAKLGGGVAVIKVGAPTEVEMREKKDRVDDAMHATRAAVEEGIVAGGGVALLRAKTVLDNITLENQDQDVGVKIVKKAVEAPIRQIVENAGLESSVIVNKVMNETGNFGFNAKTGEFEDLIKAGVIDPAKVTKTALKNAASIASLILTTDCTIVEKPEKKCHCDEQTMPSMM